MKILALDTSTEACSCALYFDGHMCDRYAFAPRQHTELILPMIEELFLEAGITLAQLDGIAFGRGPGSFTGLRIACGVAQGIGFASHLPLLPISSLATLAQGIYLESQETHVLAAIDARMNEVYFGKYILDHQGVMRCEGEEVVCSASVVPFPSVGPWYGVGSAWTTYAAQLLNRLGSGVRGYQGERYPQARAMIPLALTLFEEKNYVYAEEALPVYIRHRVV